MRGSNTSSNAHFLVRDDREPVLLVFFLTDDFVFFAGVLAAFFSVFLGVLGFEVSAFLTGFSDEAARVRFAASTRLPIPRCSRASCVGVEVEPDIFFSLPLLVDVSELEVDSDVEVSR